MTTPVPPSLVSLDDIRTAHASIRPHVVRTPLVPFPLEGFWLKPESLQPTGAFKLRGAFNAMLSLTPDARIIAGAGTVGLEILEDLPDAGTILVPVSGGGLISGVAAAVKQLRPQTRIIGVEPEEAADAHASFKTGQRVTYTVEQVGRTLADGLRVQHLGDLNWAHVQAYVDDIITVSETDLRRAAREATLRTRLVTEPSGAVTIAAALFHRDTLGATGPLVAVLSGGNLDPRLLIELLTTGEA